MDTEMVDIKVELAQLIEATKNNTKNIGTLTDDVKELSKDLKETLCGKSECDSLKDRVSSLETWRNWLMGLFVTGAIGNLFFMMR